MVNREQQIREMCNEIADMLVAKNRAYGDSALRPLRVFSDASPFPCGMSESQ
jgi:hypothetical protein